MKAKNLKNEIDAVKEKDKTNKQFTRELNQLRQRIAELEALETERKRANLLLQQERETFLNILQHAPYGVVLLGGDGKHLYVNPAFTAITGYTLENIPTGKDWMHKAYPDKAYRQKVNEFWREDSKLGGKKRVLSVVCKDGETRKIEFSSTVLDDGRAVVMLVDITERKQMEEELRESGERFRLLVDHSKDAFFLHEFGKIIDVNQHACDSLGYTREELLRLSIEDIDVDIIPGKHKDKWKQMVPGVPMTLEGIQRRKDGTTFPIEVRLVSFESGGRTLMLGLSRDVTERKQMEETLRLAYDDLKASEMRYRTLVDNIDLGINLIDVNHTIVMANAAESRHFNKSASEIIGKKCFREFEKRDTVCPDCPGVQAMTTGQSAEVETEGVGYDGSPYTARIQAFPIFGHEGNVTGFIEVTENITERKQMEEELHNSRMHLADAMDMAHIAYWEVDHPAKEFMLNDAFYSLYGTTAEAESGYRMPFEKFVRRFIHPDDEAIFDQITDDIENSTDQEQALYHEHRFIRGNGEIRYVGVRSRVFRDASGNIIRTFGANQDITDLKQAEEALQKAYDELKASKEREIERSTQLEASNRELEAFSYSVSHDLRAPLRGIDGFSQALLEEYADQLDTQGKDYLRRVRAASQRLEHIIDDMLILSRVTRREMRRELVNLSTMAQGIAAELQANQPERQVSFVIAPWVVVNADPNLMRIALNNLMDNAWKFTSKHPTARIEIGVRANDGEQAYYIRDDGAGFDMAYADKLFSAFQRLHPITEFGGTGIGLATVQRIIHRHGGRVWAEGAEEQGATFYFTLPR